MAKKQSERTSLVSSTSGEQTCPVCEATGVTKSIEDDKFVYGSGESAVELSVKLPVYSCAACDFQYFDYEGEAIRHRAVCEHLGVLPPEAIVEIRKKHGVSRAAFAELTGLGEASLSRWEKGINIQNPGNDRYIRLLEDARVMQQLRYLSDRQDQGSQPSSDKIIEFKGRSLKAITPGMQQRRKSFQLRRVA